LNIFSTENIPFISIFKTYVKGITCTLDSGINVGVCLLILGFFQWLSTSLLKGVRVLFFFISYLLNIRFLLFFPSAIYKKIKLTVILRGGYAYSRGYVYCFCQIFKGLRLFTGVRLFWSLGWKEN